MNLFLPDGCELLDSRVYPLFVQWKIHWNLDFLLLPYNLIVYLIIFPQLKRMAEVYKIALER